ncbi:putative inositol hexakisphosphate [Hamiltosporidium tvaerminnensis]|uniref:Putative inositol hexakisphosphate n=1 Tax=Hamiltosporidium tvaerminnensis TaxID=1176355 RepID=A0A4Q9LWA7_9MICR|nr:putative inositol hexakisphosphate [Hamiltosporidium tvaerminnensis]
MNLIVINLILYFINAEKIEYCVSGEQKRYIINSPPKLKNFRASLLKKFPVSVSIEKRQKELKNKDIKDLENLNISGSAQPNILQLTSLLNILNTLSKKIIFVDLRAESHFFISPTDNITLDCKKYDEDIINQEEIDTKDFTEPYHVVMTYNRKEKKVVKVEDVITEKKFVERDFSDTVEYYRMPIKDHMAPDRDILDKFINFIKGKPKGTYWIHFHCNGGKGRTTYMMTIMDILINGKNSTLDEIIGRMYLLGGSDMSEFNDKHKNQHYKRYQILKGTYQDIIKKKIKLN